MSIAYIIWNDKYGACTALLRADNGVKLCVVDFATLNNSIHVFVLPSGFRQEFPAYVAARYKEVFKVGRA